MNHIHQLKECLSSNEVFIQIHNSPDPDALASGCALKVLLENVGVKSKLLYCDNISKDNIVKILKDENIEIYNMKEIKDFTRGGEIITVDCQPFNSNVTELEGTYVGCLDHHQTSKVFNVSFRDIREEYGACSTILYEYFEEINLVIPDYLKVLLFYGIKVDTLDLARGAIKSDVSAYCSLCQSLDVDKLGTLSINSMKAEELIDFRESLRHLEIHEKICYVYVGANKTTDRIAVIADYLLSVDDIDFVVAYSEMISGVKLSVRSLRPEWNAGSITTNCLEGIGNGGGHSHMAGGFIPSKSFIEYNGIGNIAGLIEEIFSREFKKIIS